MTASRNLTASSMVKALTTSFFLLLIFGANRAAAEPVVVVTQGNFPISTLSRQDISDLFLGKRKISFSGINLVPIDISDEGLRETFYKQIADMSAIRVNAYWARVVFSAQGRPPRILTLPEAQALITNQQGIITYMPENNASGFKIILRLSQ
ncbi:MAG: hypothetical protein ACKVN9_02015 [Methylophilaceae bacterium]